MKNHLLKLCFILLFTVICSAFVVPGAKADQSEKDLVKHIVSVLHLSTAREQGLLERSDVFRDENSYSDVFYPSRQVKVSLTDGLKVFCTFKKAYSAIEEIYEKENRYKYGAFLGVNIAF